MSKDKPRAFLCYQTFSKDGRYLLLLVLSFTCATKVTYESHHHSHHHHHHHLNGHADPFLWGTSANSSPPVFGRLIRTRGHQTMSSTNKASGTSSSSSKMARSLVLPGDIVFGGLFPIHQHDSSKGCGKIDPERGVQRLEAMLFTLDKINNNESHLLPGIKLGALVMDTCGSDYIALDRALEIVQTAAVADGALSTSPRDYNSCLKQQQHHATDNQRIAGLGLMPGLIGAASSTESIQVASLFRLFRIPMISYASTSAELSDKKRYEFFARTVPSDIYQSKAVIDILQSFSWTYVSVIYSDGEYGSSLFEEFQRRASASNICIAHAGKLNKRGKVDEFREHVKALMEKEKARVVVLFIEAKDVRKFLKAVTKEISAESLPYFQWVASDGWGTQKALLSDSNASLASEGAITLEIKTAPLPGFDEYFRDLMSNPEANVRNPWFTEFCQANYAKQVAMSAVGLLPCMPPDYQQDSKTVFVHNAVYAMTLALREIHKKSCGPDHFGICDEMIENLKAVNVYRTILGVSFIDPIGRKVQFDATGDAVGQYNIYKYRRDVSFYTSTSSPTPSSAALLLDSFSSFRYQYDHVGEWAGELRISDSMKTVVPVINGTKVRSKCSDPCGVGFGVRVLVKGCCWECFDCKGENEYLPTNESQCISCPKGHWPSAIDRLSCYKLPLKKLEFMSWHFILSSLIAFLGMLMTIAATSVYAIFRETHLVKASSRELSFIILAGCFITFLTTFLYLVTPTVPVCVIRRMLFGLGIASIYSAITVKINRIYRIFEAAAKSSQQPPMISPESQLILVSCFVGFQVALSLVSMLFDPPGVKEEAYPERNLKNWYKICTITDRSYALLMALTIFLIVVATYYAIRTRNCPEPYREARVVGFSVYTTCIIWLAFVPLFFTTKSSSFELQTTVICISLSLCAWVVLICLFAQRLYIIVFRPSKNVKPGKFTLSAGVGKHATMFSKVTIQHQQLMVASSLSRQDVPTAPPTTCLTAAVTQIGEHSDSHQLVGGTTERALETVLSTTSALATKAADVAIMTSTFAVDAESETDRKENGVGAVDEKQLPVGTSLNDNMNYVLKAMDESVDDSNNAICCQLAGAVPTNKLASNDSNNIKSSNRWNNELLEVERKNRQKLILQEGSDTSLIAARCDHTSGQNTPKSQSSYFEGVSGNVVEADSQSDIASILERHMELAHMSEGGRFITVRDIIDL